MDFWSYEVLSFRFLYGFILHLAISSQSVLFYKTYFSIVTYFFVEFAEFSEGLEPIFWDAGIGKTVCEHVSCWIDMD